MKPHKPAETLDANTRGGQLQAADFVLSPSLQFSGNTGGVGAAMGGLLGRTGGALGALGGQAGGLNFKEAETTLLLADVRSEIQAASAERQASKWTTAWEAEAGATLAGPARGLFENT